MAGHRENSGKFHSTDSPSPSFTSQDVGAAIMNEAEEENYLWVEEDCCSNRPSNWQYTGVGAAVTWSSGGFGTAGCVTSPQWRCKLSGKFAMETVEGCLASCRKSKAPHAPSGINSPANQRSLWENEEVTALPGLIKSVADTAGMLYHLEWCFSLQIYLSFLQLNMCLINCCYWLICPFFVLSVIQTVSCLFKEKNKCR